MSDDIDIPGPPDILRADAKLEAHLAECLDCNDEELCRKGAALHRAARLAREAEANFKYYEGSEEF